jgi:hypothetical protein
MSLLLISFIGLIQPIIAQNPTGLNQQAQDQSQGKTSAYELQEPKRTCCQALIQWVGYSPERSGSTCGWPRTWKRRPPLSAYFSDCVSGPTLPLNGPCNGPSCRQQQLQPQKD